jgi:hypothetical protein
MARARRKPAPVEIDEGDDDFSAQTPDSAAKRWQKEFKASKEALEKWHESAKICDKRYRDEEARDDEQLNLYAAGVDVKDAVLDATSPSVEVDRRDNDQDDDVARVAAEILKRILNGDLEREDEGFPEAISLAKQDWLIPGFGLCWMRFTRTETPVAEREPQLDEEGNELAPAVPATTEVADEDVETDYVFWEDVRWSPCRVFGDCRWFAKSALLSETTFQKKFGDVEVEYAIGADPKDPTVPKTPWARVRVWEIWDKEGGCVWWYVENHSTMLVPTDLKKMARPDGSIPDPLQLSTFWPFPEPLLDGKTNSKFVPRPAYTRVQDQYKAVDDETTRIGLLRNALDASCVYDQTIGEIAEILDSNGENKAVPAKNYKALAEKGGIAASVMWKPLEAIVVALKELRELRQEDIALLEQIDGTADIMRGQSSGPAKTATEQAVVAKYASIRGGKMQKRFTAFASDGQRIRAEIICKHFSPETIKLRANVQGLPPEDQQLVEPAIELLKSDGSRFRVSVKAESVSLTDFAANKQEALDVVGMIGQFMQAVEPLVQGAPQLGPFMVRLLTVFVSRVKGGENAEPILDEMVKQVQGMAQQAAMQAQMPKPPDPRLQAEQLKLRGVAAKAQAEDVRSKADIAQTAMEMQQSQQEHVQTMQSLEQQVRTSALQQALGVQPGGAK